MNDLEHTAIDRLRTASEMSLRLFNAPLVITYSGGKDSDVLLHLAESNCCSELKEGGGKDRFIATGVRWAESAARKKNHGYGDYQRHVPKHRGQADEGAD